MQKRKILSNLLTKEDKKKHYEKAKIYWSNIPATIDGMLGGLAYVNSTDIEGSRAFLNGLQLIGKQYALDCGAGIGRVTKNLLMAYFEQVDLVEQDAVFAKKAQELCTDKHLGTIFNIGLQDFTPVTGKYDLIWAQWVLGQLTDNDLLECLRRMRLGLKSNGYFVMKDNITSKEYVIKDKKDASVTRPLSLYIKLLQKSGFQIVQCLHQADFPKGLYPIYMIACKPKDTQH